MPLREESTKIFFDVLSDYWDLKYIFEYGFYWDNRLTGLLLDKNSLTVRELANILVKPVYQNSVTTSWWNHTAGNNTKKSTRKLIWNNHYRLATDLWFQRLYACFGSNNCYDAKKYIQSCSRSYRFYSNCLDENDQNRCSYRRLCQIEELAESFIKLAENHSLCVNDYPILADIARQYADVVIQTRQSLSLKENTWTRKYFKTLGILSSSEDIDIYESFLDMIRFFACFAPLSVLGINFLRHLSVSDTGQDFALIRNLPPNFGLEQEYIYRSLHAITNHLTVFYDEPELSNGKYKEHLQEYLPCKLKYRDKNMDGLKGHLYLEARKIVNGAYVDELTLLPLFTGAYLKEGRPFEKKDEVSPGNAPIQPEPTISCIVDYYYSPDTSYLINRRYDGWRKEIDHEEELPGTIFLDSPYYPGDKKWRADCITYRIRKSDYPGFRLHIDSFGDFAYLHPLSESADIPSADSPIPIHYSKKGKMNESASLLSIYHSSLLAERIRKPLPPRLTELEWLSFIMEHYPNMCRIFLDDDTVSKLQNKVHSDITACTDKTGKRLIPCGWFQESRYEFPSRVADLPGHTVEKYRGILHAIRNQKILVYEYRDHSAHVFPYALEYDVTRHLTSRRNMPIDIMCYDLDEMRTIRISYKDIRIKNARTQEDFMFSNVQKLYHILAYALRCAFKKKDSIPTRINRVLDCCWKTKPEKYNDNYTRCIKKRFHRYMKNNSDSLLGLYFSKYESARKLFDKFGSSQDITFFKRAFGYYYQRSDRTSEELFDSLSDFQWQYQTALLDIFHDSYQSLNSTARANALTDALTNIDHMDVWELIAGNETDDIESEIAFFNEQFQNAEVTFLLKEVSEQNIDLVYHLFSNFICVGEALPDNRLQFTITYEKFYYRKIHMLLMALESMIEHIAPARTAEIIKKRHDNKEGFHHVRTHSNRNGR